MLKFPNVNTTSTNVVINDERNPNQIGMVVRPSTNYYECPVTGAKIGVKVLKPFTTRTIQAGDGKFYNVTVVLTPVETLGADPKVVQDVAETVGGLWANGELVSVDCGFFIKRAIELAIRLDPYISAHYKPEEVVDGANKLFADMIKGGHFTSEDLAAEIIKSFVPVDATK